MEELAQGMWRVAPLQFGLGYFFKLVCASSNGALVAGATMAEDHVCTYQGSKTRDQTYMGSN